jgi:Nitroreductase family
MSPSDDEPVNQEGEAQRATRLTSNGTGPYACVMEFDEVIKRRRMVHAFTAEPLAPGTAERLLRAANRAPSAGFSQGYSFLVLEGREETAPFWQLLYEQAASEATTKDDSPEQVDALSTAPLVIVPLASKDVYLDRCAQRYAPGSRGPGQ